MHNKFLFTLLAAFFLVSCNSGLHLRERVTIDADYPLHPFQFGTFCDRSGHEYLYFANLDYNYEINIYDSMYHHVRKIKLEIPGGEYTFYGCLVKSMDTILVLSNPYKNNRLLYFDSLGHCYRTVFLNRDVVAGNNLFSYHFQSNSLSGNTHTSGDYLYLFMDFRESYDEKQTPRPSAAYKKYYYRHRYKTPYILKINLKNPNEYNFGYQGLQYGGHLCDTGECIGSRLFISCANHKVFAWFESSDKLFVCNENMEIEREITVMSRKTSIGRMPYKPEEKINIYGYGRIYYVFFDQNKHLYYLIVRHNLSFEDNTYVSYYDGAPFSILVYDEQFNKKGEKRIRSDKYDYLYTFLTKKGLCLVKTSKSSDYDPKKIRFDAYRIGK